MDKKQAEEEAMKKAKDAQHAAGKNSGMSGRDLVCLNLCDESRASSLIFASCSSRTTPSGSRIRRMGRRTSGTSRSTDKSRRRRIGWRRKRGYTTSHSKMARQGLWMKMETKMEMTGWVMLPVVKTTRR